MILIKCPECGKDNVSNSAVSCPGCGYNIQAHMKKKQRQEMRQEKNERKQLAVERRNDPVYKKRKIKTICVIITIVIFAVLLFVFGMQIKTEKSYEKDLSSVFGIAPDMTIEDIIELEAVKYGHTEYNLEQVQDGKLTRLEFAPNANTSSNLRYRHHYFFFTDTGLLKSISYYDYSGGYGKCKHVGAIKKAVLEVSPNWDDKEYDGLFLYMNGNIDSVKCRILYENGECDKAISLLIDREE